ncbi:hypothetical protein A8709_09265 [Paenibacillus pectinilyticus]|uniref:DUF1963 domain-containing protein n=1 Tax=Paenibacillus pectinilyticus TaxID=512399 RepID=A0A1C1A5H7_9BACL|nr:hypothetical protein [Paenibacillus pectinilyticus]OCT15808.1 hypothetical protein A8709_09265 [Paenibacillus pectinilyticus]
MRTTRKPKYEIENVFPQLLNYRKMSIRLHPMREECIPSSDSKFGENIQWIVSDEWPTCSEHRQPFIPVLQIFKKDIPGFDFPTGYDTLQVLWCPNDHGEIYSPLCKAYWKNSNQVNSTSRVFSDQLIINNDYVVRTCKLNPESVFEYPSLEDLLLTNEPLGRAIMNWQQQFGEEEEAVYEYELSVADGSKLGGYEKWIQGIERPRCECDNEMEHFLTIAESEFDGGTFGRWCPDEYGDIWSVSYEVRRNIQSPLGIHLGDMGKIFFFVCKKCESLPTKTIFQCS